MTTCQTFRLPGQAGGLSPNLICHLQDLIVLASTEWAGTIFSCQSGGMRFQNPWKFCSEKKRPVGECWQWIHVFIAWLFGITRPLSQWCMVIPVGFCSKSLRPWDKMSWLAIFSQRMLDANAANVNVSWDKMCKRKSLDDWTDESWGMSPAMVGWDLNEMTQLLASLVAIKQRPNHDDSAAVGLDNPS